MVVGPLAATLVERWPRSEPLLGRPWRCRSCRRIGPSCQLVPASLRLALARRCPTCRAQIGPRPLAIELACAFAAGIALAGFGATGDGLAVAVLGLALVPVVAIDLEHRLIPDVVVLPATAAALVIGVVGRPGPWWGFLAAAAGAGGVLGLLWLASPTGMGLGDAKLGLLLGAVLGAAALPALVIAFVLGGVAGALLIAHRGAAARRMAVPFGPFLATGAIIALWWDPDASVWIGAMLG